MKTFSQFLIEASGNETSMDEFEKLVHRFLPYVLKELKIKSIPALHFKNGKDGLHIKNVPGVTVIGDSGFSQKIGTFGQTSHKNRIVVNVKNRHPLDALRTLAHELCHYHQHLIGNYGTGETGSSTENEASAKASIIMRNFDFANPELFKLAPLR
jgi:Zn-dependent peptidase ImmA (M78 family)